MPFNLAAFYLFLGFPGYLTEQAARDARAEADDPFDIDLWTFHSDVTYPLIHFFTGKAGASLDRYVRTANDVLFNSKTTIEAVELTSARA